ncbi:response regulator [Noviherbaspirillum sp. UKPF54]|uniref:response regulator n=1 Tax=Noviherbaspirillum sp. UKPF54 TaxID=2601898 RepID=UPI00352B8B74
MLKRSERPAQARRLHILIVDDVASMRRVMMGLIKEQLDTLRLSEAADGKNALQMIHKAHEDGVPVDIVITDWNMPVMDGMALLRCIRSDMSLMSLPVLLVTAHATKDMILEAARAGADGYIVKPFNAETLHSKIERIVAKRCAHVTAH